MVAQDPVEFGLYIKELRKEKKLTLVELSRLSSVSQPHLSHIENGKRGIPSPETLRKLSVPLGVPYELLLRKAGHLDDGSMAIQGEFTPPEDTVFATFKVFANSSSDGLNVNGIDFTQEQAIAIVQILERERISKKEIKNYLNQKGIEYNGHQLTEQDRQRILDMLKTLFPEYQEPMK